jgi:outer membrane biosynthesis protein TonB
MPRTSAAETTLVAVPSARLVLTVPETRTVMPSCRLAASDRVSVALPISWRTPLTMMLPKPSTEPMPTDASAVTPVPPEPTPPSPLMPVPPEPTPPATPVPPLTPVPPEPTPESPDPPATPVPDEPVPDEPVPDDPVPDVPVPASPPAVPPVPVPPARARAVTATGHAGAGVVGGGSAAAAAAGVVGGGSAAAAAGAARPCAATRGRRGYRAGWLAYARAATPPRRRHSAAGPSPARQPAARHDASRRS